MTIGAPLAVVAIVFGAANIGWSEYGRLVAGGMNIVDVIAVVLVDREGVNGGRGRRGGAMKKTVAVVVAVLAVAVLLASPISAQAQVAAAVSGVEVVRLFSPARDKPLTRTGVAVDQGGWRIEPASAGPVRLFEVAGSSCEACRLVYRAKVKTRNLSAPAFLEMWVRVPGKGQFFSRGLDQTVSGSVDWTSIEIPFFFQKGQRADLVKLNVSFQGDKGSLWVKDVELLKAPLP